MLLTIRTTHRPATDLGFLLHKHPDHVHTREFPFGGATVFYPEATDQACTAAVLLDVDPVGMVRGRGGKGGAEDQYVNDRPYVASSLLSVVLTRWFNSALSGRCEQKPELAAAELPLEVHLAAVPCRGGEAFLRELFEPLGYQVEATGHALDDTMPSLGPSRLFTVTLRATCRLSDVLTHLCSSRCWTTTSTTGWETTRSKSCCGVARGGSNVTRPATSSSRDTWCTSAGSFGTR
jgi:3' terminal RNA ribose 2'-O-methyltransferase Hen1